MKRDDALLSSFDRSWQEFCKAWKKARAKASEKSIHDLRVNTRRLIATLELAHALTRRQKIGKLQRRFKKVLKKMGPLRDVQVQLEGLSGMKPSGLLNDFQKALERRERHETEDVRAELKRGKKRKLSENVQDVRSEFSPLHVAHGPGKVPPAIERVLMSRRNEFLRSEKHFHKVQPPNDEALHEMRIALKKLRYVVEAAQPILGPSAKQSAKQMQQFQQLLGDTRDVDILRVKLEKWANRRGKKIAVVPALERLQSRKAELLKKITERSTVIGELLETETLRPTAEKTHVVSTQATESEKTSLPSKES